MIMCGVIFRKKSELKDMMFGLIKNFKTMAFRSSMHAVIMQEKMWILKGLENMKGKVSSLSILPQVLPNRMAVLNGNSSPSLIGYVLYSMGGKFFVFLRNGLPAEATNTATLLENKLLTPNRYLSLLQKMVREREACCLWCKHLVKCMSPHIRITPNGLS